MQHDSFSVHENHAIRGLLYRAIGWIHGAEDADSAGVCDAMMSNAIAEIEKARKIIEEKQGE